ncbi:MAG: hypothetical protein GY832_27145 [Chloroflexi bacterium]|nr:hypothetical protein [Chloroflexota bacterium]
MMKKLSIFALLVISTLLLVFQTGGPQSTAAQLPQPSIPKALDQLETPVSASNSVEEMLSPSNILFSYQGHLLDSNDDPVDEVVDMIFDLYSQETGGASFWTEAYTGTQAITVTNGLFHVLLGSLTPIDPTAITDDTYLELTINGETLNPRELLTSVAFAVEASTLTAGANTLGALYVNGSLFVEGNDLRLSGRGGGRALVDRTDLGYLGINYGNDYGGWRILGPAKGSLDLNGNNIDSIGRLQIQNTSGSLYFTAISPANGGDFDLFHPADGGTKQLSIFGSSSSSTMDVEILDGDLTVVVGDVGIGTTSPEEKLHVAGSTRVDGSIYLNGPNLYMGGTTDDHIALRQDGDGTHLFIAPFGGQNPGDVFKQVVIGGSGDPVNLGVSGDLGIGGSCTAGAYIEANLQTEDEQQAGGIDRFEEGDVLCWGIDQLELCSIANDRLVQAVADAEGRPIVLGAEVVKVIGPVQRGDVLVASDTPGYAMVNNDPIPGSVIAQALEDFDGGRGMIKAMIRKW